MKRLKIAVLFGGCSPEYSVSLQSAAAVLQNISYPWGKQFSRLALGSKMIGLVCLHVQTASGLLFFPWRLSKECNGRMERSDAIG